MIADRRRRIHDHHRKSRCRKLQRHLLRQKLGALISARHLLQRHRHRLIAHPTLRHADTAHRAGVNHPLDPWLARRFQQIPRALYVRAVQLIRMPRPEPVIGGHMKDQPASRHRPFERSGIPQIAGNRLDFQFPQLARRPHQRPHLMAPLASAAAPHASR